MTIQRFSQLEFEQALPKHKVTKQPLWLCQGLQDGELQYHMPIDDISGIIIRSSIDFTGKAAATGEDSIRAWIVDQNLQPLGSKVSRWTTRQPGWDKRLTDVLRQLWSWRKAAGNCPDCGQPMGIFKVKKDGPTKGKVFCKCSVHNHFRWLDN